MLPRGLYPLQGRLGLTRVDLGRTLGRGGLGNVHPAVGPGGAEAVKRLRSDDVRRPRRRAALLAEIRSYENYATIGVLAPLANWGDDPQLGPWYSTRQATLSLDSEGALGRSSKIGALFAPPERLLALVVCIRRLGARVNAAGLVGRDHKPGNIVVYVEDSPTVRPCERSVQVALIDPQLWGAVGARRTVVAGTPRFMPIEALMSGPLASTDDDFALSIVQRELMAVARGLEPWPTPDGQVVALRGGGVLGIPGIQHRPLEQLDLLRRRCGLATFVAGWRQQLPHGGWIDDLLEDTLIGGSADDAAKRLSNEEVLAVIDATGFNGSDWGVTPLSEPNRTPARSPVAPSIVPPTVGGPLASICPVLDATGPSPSTSLPARSVGRSPSARAGTPRTASRPRSRILLAASLLNVLLVALTYARSALPLPADYDLVVPPAPAPDSSPLPAVERPAEAPDPAYVTPSQPLAPASEKENTRREDESAQALAQVPVAKARRAPRPVAADPVAPFNSSARGFLMPEFAPATGFSDISYHEGLGEL